MRTLIAEVAKGTRRIAGTDFPILDQLHRVQQGSRVRWVVTRGLCNGIPDSAHEFRTRREARLALFRIKVMHFGNTPRLAYEPGGILFGFNQEAPEVSGDACQSDRAKALFDALNSKPEHYDLILGVLADGRWALVGCDCEGYPFAFEI